MHLDIAFLAIELKDSFRFFLKWPDMTDQIRDKYIKHTYNTKQGGLR